jgi:hypothetical protein
VTLRGAWLHRGPAADGLHRPQPRHHEHLPHHLGEQPEGTKLQRIAYVQASMTDPAKPRFAETVAVNRGVNVRSSRT